MNQTPLNIEVMKKVRRIYIARKLVVPAGLFAAAAAFLALTVSIPHVLANMATLTGLREAVSYFTYSFVHTEIYVQCALFAGLIFLLWTAQGISHGARAIK